MQERTRSARGPRSRRKDGSRNSFLGSSSPRHTKEKVERARAKEEKVERSPREEREKARAKAERRGGERRHPVPQTVGDTPWAADCLETLSF